MAPKAFKRKRERRRSIGDMMMKATATRRFTREVISKMSTRERSMYVRSISCAETMNKAHTIYSMDSVAEVLEQLTQNNWDHVFIINEDGVPMGRIHAVDILKLIARKTVNRSVAWMHAVPAQQLVNVPPMTVRTSTPLLKAGALMLAHDINQIAVVDGDGTLVGVVGYNTMARHMPKFII